MEMATFKSSAFQKFIHCDLSFYNISVFEPKLALFLWHLISFLPLTLMIAHFDPFKVQTTDPSTENKSLILHKIDSGDF